jgi:uncharacterized protein
VMEGFDKPFQQAKTNRRGEWSIDNLAAGKWKFHFGGVQELDEKSVDVEIGESGTVKVPDVTLGKPVDPTEFLNAELKRAAELMQTRQPGEARKVYEGIMGKFAQIPDDFRAQLYGAIAQTYAAEDQPQQALEHLKKAIDLDPANTDFQLVYGELLMQAGKREEAEKILQTKPGYLGRTAIQKIMYFLQVCGVPVRYRFDVHHYGPFCSAILSDIDWLTFTGAIVDRSPKPDRYSNYRAGDEARPLIAQHHDELEQHRDTIRRVVGTLAPVEPDRLELISTLDYAYRELCAQANSEPTKENVIARFREIKGDKFPQRDVEEAFERMKEAGFF